MMGQALPYLSALSHIWTPASPGVHKAFTSTGLSEAHVCTEFGSAVGVQAALPNLEASMQPCRFDKLALSNAARQSSEKAVILAPR